MLLVVRPNTREPTVSQESSTYPSAPLSSSSRCTRRLVPDSYSNSIIVFAPLLIFLALLYCRCRPSRSMRRPSPPPPKYELGVRTRQVLVVLVLVGHDLPSRSAGHYVL